MNRPTLLAAPCEFSLNSTMHHQCLGGHAPLTTLEGDSSRSDGAHGLAQGAPECGGALQIRMPRMMDTCPGPTAALTQPHAWPASTFSGAGSNRACWGSQL